MLEILVTSDMVIGHGLRENHYYRQSLAQPNIRTVKVVRHGANFETIADIRCRFDIGFAGLANAA